MSALGKTAIGICLFVLFVCLVGVISESTASHSKEAQRELEQQATAQANANYNSLTPEEKRQIEAEHKKAAAEQEAAEEQARMAYAKFMEESLLRKDMNVDVIAYGPKHKYMKLKWVLVSKAVAFNFGEQRGDLIKQMRDMGFSKFVLTDGYDESWTWDLTK